MGQSHYHYHIISRAIEYAVKHFRDRPSLDDMAAAAGLSPSHFQRVFTEWAGVSPSQFIHYLGLDYAKSVLRDAAPPSLLEAALETGLSGTGRLHDMFVTIEAVTPGDFKTGGAGLTLAYKSYDSPFGLVILAASERGLTHLLFDDEAAAHRRIAQDYPNAELVARESPHHAAALRFFNLPQQPEHLRLHLKGTAFQLKIWEALLSIPPGRLTSYSVLADKIGNAKAARAVGSAVGRNPVSFIIPCHRVIQNSGALGGYYWGLTKKRAMLGWEAARF